MLAKANNISCCNLNNEDMLREVTVKIGLERIDMQEGIMVEALLDSGATGLMISLEFARKQRFKLKKLEKPMYVRNMDGLLNKKRPIEYTMEVNIYYQGYRERTEIDVIGGQKWTVILRMPWIACHNSEIDWRTGEDIWKNVESSRDQSRENWGSKNKRKKKQRRKLGRNGKKEENR